MPRTPPLAGDKPQRYISLRGCRCSGDGGVSPAGAESIPDRSPGHAFVLIALPAGAGTPRCENWMHWLMEGSGVVCATHPAPSWGQAPALHFLLRPSAVVVRATVVSVAGRRRNPSWIDSGHAFVPMTNWGARMTAFLAGRPGGIYGGAGAGYSGR